MFERYIDKRLREKFEDWAKSANDQLASHLLAASQSEHKTSEFNRAAPAHNEVILGYSKEIRDALLYPVDKK